ncbi:MAG: HAD-IA family hydrolase [Gammaproteobacteria bacterium]|nr:HAD-IA family hydrolase [Gammaproteobacteria bacterium]
MGPYSLIIFDWDGTLMDSAGRIVSAMQTAARMAGQPVPEARAVLDVMGLSMSLVYDILFPGMVGAAREHYNEIYRHQYVVADPTPTPLFEGAEPVLQELREAGFKLAIATGKARPGLTRALGETGVGHYFCASRCADEAASKPDPAMIDALLEETGTAPERALMIGDSVHDMAMARNAGVHGLAATYGAQLRERLAEHRPVAFLDDIRLLPVWLRA